MCFDLKFGLKKKAWIVAGENLSGSSDDDTYYDLVIIETILVAFLFGQINNLEVPAVDFRNSYINKFTKENIYTVVGL